MKTRVVYPKNIWWNKHFRKLPLDAKTLCLYLIANENIGLIRTYHQHDLEITYLLGLKEEKLEQLKQIIQNTGLFFFFDEWVYINNDFSYCDYEGRDRVMESKQKEIEAIPKEVSNLFEGVVKGLRRGYKPLINPNIIINNNIENKNRVVKGKEKEILSDENTIVRLKELFPDRNVDFELEKMKDWLASSGSTKKDYVAFARNWLRKATPEEPEMDFVIRAEGEEMR